MSSRWSCSIPLRGRLPLACLLLALCYWGLAWLGLRLSIVHGNVSSVWPPTGLAVGVLLLWGRRLWPGVTLGAFLATFASGVAPGVALGVALGNTLEALVATTVLVRTTGFRQPPWTVRDVVIFLVLAVPLGALISALAGVLSLWAGGVVPAPALAEVAWTWWLGNLMGGLLIAPVLVLWVRQPRLPPTTARWLEGIGLIGLLMVVNQLVFGTWPLANGTYYPLAFLYLPPLIWVALRFGLHGATVINLLVATVAILGTALDAGPFVQATVNESLLLLQTFLGLIAATSLILAALMEERSRALQALQANRARLQAVLDTAVDGIITIDSAGIVRSFNPAAERLFGYRAVQVVGRNISMLMGDDLARHHDAFLARYLAGGAPRVVGLGREVTGRHRDGSCVHLELAVGEMWVNGQRMFTGIARDVGPRRRTEARWRQLQAELAHMGRLTLVGEMASGLAHELKQPLAAISNYAGACLLLHRSETNAQRVEHALEQIVAQSVRAVEIIQRMKDFTRRTPFQAEWLSPADLIGQVVAFMEHELQRLEVELKLELPPRPAPVLADRIQLQQVLVNLVGNALEALEQAGEGDRRPRRLVIRVSQQAGQMTVAVIDSGPGIQEAQLERLFQPFFTTKTEGTGLGLSISRSIIETHGGRLWARANPAGGMIFEFTLPLGQSEVAEEGSVAR